MDNRTLPLAAGACAEDSVFRLERECRGSKALASPSGWAYLINDTNEFLRVLFNGGAWDVASADEASKRLAERRSAIKTLCRAPYELFLVPEKSAAYPEFLPAPLNSAPFKSRPATILDARGDARYVHRDIEAAKPFGHLYFRGDSHTNWLGAYFIYRRIIETVGQHVAIQSPRSMEMFDHFVAGWDGDLYEQLTPEHRAAFDEASVCAGGATTVERLIALRWPESERRARRVDPPEWSRKFTRPTIVMEGNDPNLPRAVIIRDSTADLMIDWLGEHFSRCAAYWYEGCVFEEIIEAEQPHIVIQIAAERFATSYARTQPIHRLSDLSKDATQ